MSRYNPKIRDEFLANYQDRGMMKWNGYYLSDHTAIRTRDRRHRNSIEQYDNGQQMWLEDSLDVIAKANLKNYSIEVQVGVQKISEGELITTQPIVGKIQGFDNEGIIVNGQKINYEDIWRVDLIEY